jgi:uncharacterized surface protein with fasciclin (FAS1) repeats
LRETINIRAGKPLNIKNKREGLKKMKKLGFAFLLMFGMFFVADNALAQMNGAGTRMVGASNKTQDIVDVAMSSKDHTTLVAAVKAAGLVDTLKGKGPFTVFAPANSAFDKLPAGTVDTLLKAENKATLTRVLTYHVVAGKLDSKAVAKAIQKGNGKATLKTVSGGTLTAMIEGGNVVLMDEKGGKSKITAVDLKGSNGVIHVIDTVVMPN